jgi:hypothetical protein
MKTMKKDGQVSRDFGKYCKIGNLKVMTPLNVSARGDSLCLIIPKEIIELHGVLSGDKIRVWMLDHYRERREED